MGIKLFHREKETCGVKEIIFTALEAEAFLRVHGFISCHGTVKTLNKIQKYAAENKLKIVNDGFYEYDIIKLPPAKKIKEKKDGRKKDKA
jgi:hypothetical protein